MIDLDVALALILAGDIIVATITFITPRRTERHIKARLQDGAYDAALGSALHRIAERGIGKTLLDFLRRFHG